MSYYPKSQIKPNLYTNGNEFVYITNKNVFYVGYYYEISTGKKFTGRNPNNGEGIEILPANTQVLKTSLDYDIPPPALPNTQPNSDVIDLVGLDLGEDDDITPYNNEIIFDYPPTADFKRRLLPSPYNSTPTQKEKQIGEYRRYFAKKGNELLYIEINKDTYTKFINQDPSIALELYEVKYFPFSLRSTGTNINLAAIIERKDKWFGFSQFIQNLS